MEDFLEFNEKRKHKVIFPPELNMYSEDIILEELPRLLKDDEKVPYCSSFHLPQYSSLTVSFKDGTVSEKLELAVMRYAESIAGRFGYDSFTKYDINIYQLGLFSLPAARYILKSAKLNHVNFKNDKIIGLSFYVTKMETHQVRGC